MNELKRIVFSGLASLLFCFLLISSAWSQTDGRWEGISDEGGDVYFYVTGSEVENFSIYAYLSGGSAGSSWLWLGVGPAMPISGNSFSFSGSLFDVTGTFTSPGTSTGTYNYHDPYLGYSSGTWTANFFADPYITLSPSSQNFGDHMINTTSSAAMFTLRNVCCSNATGSVSLTGTNADQYEIISGGGSFSLSHDQSKDIYVRFVPTSIGIKYATLMVDGDSPCNDVSASLTGTGVQPNLSVSPTYRLVSKVSGQTAFSVTNTGSGPMAWTAESDPVAPWITITGGTSGTGSGTISISYEANDGEARMGTITVRAVGAVNSPQTVEIIQAAIIPERKLTASDGAASDSFGMSVSISEGYALVGANGDESYAGSAYIFEQTDSGWLQRAKLTASEGAASDYFGRSVSISEGYALVGAYGDDDNGSASGSAYIFEKPVGGWADMTETAKLIASDGAASDQFGVSVYIHEGYILVGANGDESYAGSAYIFEKPVGGWADMTETAKFTASDGAASDQFGVSVNMSEGYALVGAKGEMFGSESGSAYIFEKPVGGWENMTETAKLTASDGTANDHFGCSVSLFGDYALVGAHGPNNYVSGKTGSAYIFEKPVGGWADMTETAKLTASDAGTDDRFGVSVSIFEDYAIVGANRDDDNGSESGSAYIFERTGSGWLQLTKLTASDGAASDYFGGSVNISEGYAFVGASGDDDNGSNSGSAYIFYIGNSLPKISDINDKTIYENIPTNAISFTIFDSETLPEDLILTGESSNSTLVPNENIVFGGTGVNRTITITPVQDETGTTTITVTLSDGIDTVNDSFLLTVIISLDTDGDGLPDSLEDGYCTDSNDADTDDDGISDGDEDANHNGLVDTGETDPCNLDTDADGIQDGTELGYTLAGVGPDTDINIFQPDLDPSTTTEPLDADSDNDGLLDGEEDINHNGRVDLGETDPSIFDVKKVNAIPWILLLLLN